MVKDVLQIGNPLLKAPNTFIENFDDPKLTQVITDLIETMHEGGLIGIASPQIGENYQLFVTQPRETETRPADQADELRVYINPKIIYCSEEQSTIYEGCGCVMKAQLFGPVLRPKIVTIEAYDQTGKKFQMKADGILGRVIQHENDHLSGIEFTEKISDYRKLMALEFYLKNIKFSTEQIEASKITIKECISLK